MATDTRPSLGDIRAPGTDGRGVVASDRSFRGGHMRPSQRGTQAAIILSRWLVAPFLLGLALSVLLLIYRFFADFYALAKELPTAGWHELVVGVLNLVDISLVANLVLIVIFSSYENFIHKIAQADRDGLPDGLIDIDFGALKQKLLGSIVVIAAVDALAWYLDLEKYTDTSKLGWALAFPLMLVAAMLALAAADRLGHRANNKPE
jgi:uncharacterized protein (TIGR00645 family)